MIDANIIKHVRLDQPDSYSRADHKTKLDFTIPKGDYREQLRDNVKAISRLQEQMYANHKQSLLLVFQAMDAAGKDSTIERVVTGVNPQGVEVHSFKKPTELELAHDFLWRVNLRLPPKGKIGIFNRSHYEEVLVTRVHPQYILYQNLPEVDHVDQIDQAFWDRRFNSINEFENHIAHNGTRVLKFFLNVSKEEQKKRMLDRMNEPEKHWKFKVSDIEERVYWEDYQDCFDELLNKTAHAHAPWHVIPADDKRVMRIMVTQIVREFMESMNISWPESGPDILEKIQAGRTMLDSE